MATTCPTLLRALDGALAASAQLAAGEVAAALAATGAGAAAPRVDPGRWRLRVHGLVAHELELSLDDVMAMELVELDATLVCVHNSVGGPRIGSARWLGLPLDRLLKRAGAAAGAEQLLARSVDGFSVGVPLERVSGGQPALVAVAMNGEPLPAEHGFPARLLVPGLWGADANTKWLSELELTTWNAVRDYWNRRGWPRVPPAVRPGSRIDVPRNRAVLALGKTMIAGVAWAPPLGSRRSRCRSTRGRGRRRSCRPRSLRPCGGSGECAGPRPPASIGCECARSVEARRSRGFRSRPIRLDRAAITRFG